VQQTLPPPGEQTAAPELAVPSEPIKNDTQHWPPAQSSLPSHADLMPVQLAPQLGPALSQQQASGESQDALPHATHEACKGSHGPVEPPVPPPPSVPPPPVPPEPPVPPTTHVLKALSSASQSPPADAFPFTQPNI
jgi:hypothetical protein